MIVDAWQDSANPPVGYPMVNVRNIESGKVKRDRGPGSRGEVGNVKNNQPELMERVGLL
ncbi:MAG: hypothetical protein QOJ15_3700 [Bradyrhizobium sp.]|jgi:hypothetical protein|nr:hypothetical protein [Bradyrhizobium sp.]